jgi:hypothetical protein
MRPEDIVHPTERKDLRIEIANEGMYLHCGEEGLELWEVVIDRNRQRHDVFTGFVFPDVESAHDYVFGNIQVRRIEPPPLPVEYRQQGSDWWKK